MALLRKFIKLDAKCSTSTQLMTCSFWQWFENTIWILEKKNYNIEKNNLYKWVSVKICWANEIFLLWNFHYTDDMNIKHWFTGIVFIYLLSYHVCTVYAHYSTIKLLSVPYPYDSIHHPDPIAKYRVVQIKVAWARGYYLFTNLTPEIFLKKNYDELLIRIIYRRITYSNKNNCLFGYMPITDVGNVHHSFL